MEKEYKRKYKLKKSEEPIEKKRRHKRRKEHKNKEIEPFVLEYSHIPVEELKDTNNNSV